MIPLGPVVARSRVGVARAAAWTYLVEPDRRAEWWPELQLEARVGGTVAERWSEGEGDAAVSRDASGTVDVWVDGHAVGFTWREAGDARDTAVLITLRTQGLDTGITVTETGFDALPAASERAAASQEGWQVLLRDLTAALEAAQAAGAFGEGEADGAGGGAETGAGAAAAGALEVAAPELDGELDDGELDVAAEPQTEAAAGQTEIEVEAEPTVGDLPELETGPVAIVATDDGSAETGHEQDLDQTIQIDRSQLPDAEQPDAEQRDAELPERQKDTGAGDGAADGDEAADGGEADARDDAGASDDAGVGDEPDEPDFDTLIRGN